MRLILVSTEAPQQPVEPGEVIHVHVRVVHRLFPADHTRRVVELFWQGSVARSDRPSGWCKNDRIRPRRPTPGAPYTYVTTKAFLLEFDLDTLRDLPDFEALEEAGLLSKENLLAGDIPAGLVSSEEASDGKEPEADVVEALVP